MGFVSTLFSKCDGFEQPVKLSIEKDDSVKTGFGGLLTIAAVTATLVLAAATISDFLNHTNPALSYDYDYLPDPGYLELNSSNFLFSITNQDSDFFLDSAMVSFNLIYVVQKRFENGTISRTKHPVPLVKCTREYWAGFESDYDTQNMGNRLCPTIDQYNISGQFLSSEYIYLQLEVQKCKNRTDQPDIICKPKEELDTILPGKDIAISFMYTDNMFNLNDWQNPVKRYVTNLHWDIAPEVLSKKTDVFVSQYDIVTDDNYLLDGYWQSEISTYQINGVSRDQNFAPESGDVYMKIYIRKSSSFTIATRQFLKSGQVLESIGGLAGFWFTLLGVVAVFYNKRTFQVKMANSLYEFDQNDNNHPPKKPGDKTASISGKKRRCCNSLSNCVRKITCRRAKAKTVDYGIKSSDQIQSPSNLGLAVGQKEEELQPTDRVKMYVRSFQTYSKRVGKKMTYSSWDFIIGILACGRRKKDKLISLAAERIEEDTDIIHILKRIQDLEKMKSLFFNEHQKRVFSYSRPPLISLEENELPTKPKPKPVKQPKDNTQRPKRSFIRKSFEKLKLRRRNLFQKDPLEDVDSVSKFALIFESYRKLRKVKNSRLNKDLIKLLDPDMGEALYNLDFELKVDQTFRYEYFKIMAIRVFEDLFFNAKRKKANLSKEDAANIIARRWLMRKKKIARDVKKMKTLIINAKSQQNLDENAKKERIGRESQEIDIFDEMHREDPEEHEGSDEVNIYKMPEIDLDIRDDEILNDVYNYGEEIENFQTPIISARIPNSKLADTSPTPRLVNDGDIKMEIHSPDASGNMMLSPGGQRKSRFAFEDLLEKI